MKCTIQTITPVHVGNGKEYDASEYYLGKSSNGKPILVRVDINRLFTSLSEEERDEFIQHLTDPSFQLEDYLKNILRRKPPKISSYLAHRLSARPTAVQETIKTMNKSYIPGSSIKGSLRTAILHNLISRADIYSISNLIQRGGRGNYVNFWKAQEFQNQFFLVLKMIQNIV